MTIAEKGKKTWKNKKHGEKKKKQFPLKKENAQSTDHYAQSIDCYTWSQISQPNRKLEKKNHSKNGNRVTKGNYRVTAKACMDKIRNAKVLKQFQVARGTKWNARFYKYLSNTKTTKGSRFPTAQAVV